MKAINYNRILPHIATDVLLNETEKRLLQYNDITTVQVERIFNKKT